MSSKMRLWVGLLALMIPECAAAKQTAPAQPAPGAAQQASTPSPTPPLTGPAPTLTLNLQLVPKAVIGRREAQVLVTIDTTQELADAQLELTVPPGFHAQQASFILPAISRSAIVSTILQAQGSDVLAGERLITAQVSVAGRTATSPRRILASRLLSFDYSPEISLWAYFVWSLVGVAFGYLLRLAVRVLSILPAPSPTPEETPAPTGRITAFVRRHYYLTDFMVTLGLALILLIGLTQSGRPPQTAAYWYGAFVTGVGLGLFTNSELLTKLKR